MSIWDALIAEFDAWAASGLQAPLWWRDDDAVDATPALDRLLAIAEKFSAPITLAVIPAKAKRALAERIAGYDHVQLAQHGFAHTNNGAENAKKIELGGDKPLGAVIADLASGQSLFVATFGVQPKVLVPPWNRIDEAVARALPGLGFECLSCFAAKPALEDMPTGLHRLSTHLDPIAWRGDRGFMGDDEALAPFIDQLRQQRARETIMEPAGLLTHHLDHNAAVWQFTEALVELVHDHPGACWVPGQVPSSS